MDVGFYLGELLMQQGEVSVPGLGYFVQVRVSGYYDEVEHKFHPPYHQARFDVQSIDDDALAEYIALKKNISVASAKYFAEKYITNLKQNALLGEVPIGNLGVFYTELTQLTFKPADKIIDDSIFYGFGPISLNKIGDVKPAVEKPKVELNYPPKYTSPKPELTPEQSEEITAPTSEESVQTYAEPTGESPEFFDPASGDDEEETQGPLRLLVTILIVIVVIGVGITALYEYKPDTFAKMAFWKKDVKVVDTIKPKPVVAVKPDTVAADTLQQPAPVKIDTVDAVAPKKKETIIVEPADKPEDKKTHTIIIETVKPKPAPKKTETIIIEHVKPKNSGTVIAEQPTVTPKKKEPVVAQQPTTIANSTIPAPTKQPVVTTPKKEKAAVTKPPVETLGKPGAINAQASDAVGTRRYEVYVYDTPSVAEANAVVKRLKSAGYDPRWVTDAPGTLYHISIGHFATEPEAKDFAVHAIESGKMPRGDAFGIQIIPQK